MIALHRKGVVCKTYSRSEVNLCVFPLSAGMNFRLIEYQFNLCWDLRSHRGQTSRRTEKTLKGKSLKLWHRK